MKGTRAAACRRCSGLARLLSVVIAIIASEPLVQRRWGRALAVGEFTFGIYFATEFLVRFWAVGVDPRYRGWRGRSRHLFRGLTLIDLLSILPFFIGFGSAAFLVRLVRLFRLVVLSRLVRYSNAMQLVVHSVYSRRFELILAVGMAGCVVLVAAAALYAAEGDVQPEHFGSIPRATCWPISTLTTVGYGDVVPITPVGKLCAAATAMAGIGPIAMPTGILATAFSEAFAQSRLREALAAEQLASSKSPD